MHGLHGMPLAGILTGTPPGTTTGRLLAQPTAQAAAPQPRLVHAAHEFEAQLMKELLQPLEEGDGLTGEDSDDSQGSNGALGEFATETLGQALSEQGGLGIADDLVRTLSQNSTGTHGEKVTRNGYRNTRLSPTQ